MKAMVLAAGLGLRMRPLTLLRAKPVLPVLNRPLLHWTLELLRRHGVTDVVVNLHHLPATVRKAVGDGRTLGLRVSYSFERELLGTGGGPRKVRRLLGDDPMLLVNGDVLFDFDLSDLVRRHVASAARATLALKAHAQVEAYGAVVTGPGGFIRALAGLPRPARGRRLLFTGVHVLDPALLDRLPPGPSDSVRDLYARLVGEGERLLGVRVPGAWYDFGDPSLYLASQLSMMSSGFRGAGRARLVHPEARIHPRARVTRSVVGAGAVVGEGAVVSGSVLWDGARVGRGARVSASIVATGARVADGEAVGRAVALPPRGQWESRMALSPPGRRA
ncbi:MAG: nucleotidyltransferase [Acidobacteria bacterium]|nr:MAG: nucleotidyltransferase [Acidobacteriota bacterium]